MMLFYSIVWEDSYNPLLGCTITLLDIGPLDNVDNVQKLCDVVVNTLIDHVILFDCTCKIEDAIISRRGLACPSLKFVTHSNTAYTKIPLRARVVNISHHCC